MTVLTGTQIDKARILTLRKGLELEIKGLKLSQGKSCYTIIKNEFGYKGNKASVLKQISEYIDKNILPEIKEL